MKMLKKHKDIFALAICLIAVFQLYLFTMPPAFKSNDSPETITSAYMLGISHPPGYPLFVMAAKIFSLLPIGAPAFRINLFSAFLAIITLLLTYFLIRQNTYRLFNYENRIMNLLGVLILAFSYIFWNQAIEAKGGIYMLNLLLLTVILFYSLRLFNSYNSKYLYLISYIYGMSLTNHWPSMIILLPAFGFFLVKYFKQIKVINWVLIILFAIIGLSVYAYLPIRSSYDGAFVFMAKPNTWANFWWTLFRSGYSELPAPSLSLYIGQVREFLNLFINNYSFLWILIFFGGFVLAKKSLNVFLFYTSAIIIYTGMVVFYNRTETGWAWMLDIFLMPAQYILLIFVICGACFAMVLIKQRMLKQTVIGLVAAITIFSVVVHFQRNDRRYDYLAYDYGNNLLNTMEQGSMFMAEGDHNMLPIYYLQIIEKKRQDIKFIPTLRLNIDWGIDEFTKKYGSIEMKPGTLGENVNNVIGTFIHGTNIYRSTYSPVIDKDKIIYNYKQKGLVRKYMLSNEQIAPDIFRLYSYDRGTFDKYVKYNGENIYLMTWYPETLMLQAFELLVNHRPKDSIWAYNKALYFCYTDNMKSMNAEMAESYYNMSLAYKELGDEDQEIKCLKKSIAMKKDYWIACAALGMVYYNDKILPMAKDMFEKAIQYGSDNKQLLQSYVDAIGNIDLNKQYEALFNMGTDIMAKGNYERAIDIYEYLIDQNYRTADVNKNIGVYYFKNNNFDEALKYFNTAKKINNSMSINLHIAYTYYKMGKSDKALDILMDAVTKFGNDPQLVNMYNQIQQAKEKGLQQF